MRQLKTQLLDLQLPLEHIDRVLPLRVFDPMVRHSVCVQTKGLLGHLVVYCIKDFVQSLGLAHH